MRARPFIRSNRLPIPSKAQPMRTSARILAARDIRSNR
jgi:hypothetical protein